MGLSEVESAYDVAAPHNKVAEKSKECILHLGDRYDRQRPINSLVPNKYLIPVSLAATLSQGLIIYELTTPSD